jgi:hypothetical protein
LHSLTSPSGSFCLLFLCRAVKCHQALWLSPPTSFF